MSFVLATSRRWHDGMAERLSARTGRPFHLVTSKNELTVERLDALSPEYVFFPHWSYIIPDEILNRYECVIFHMTDLPFGRGGSPLQNLISRGIYQTQMSAIRCVTELDAGPIYLKRPLSLHGAAEEIYLRAGRLTEEMILTIIAEHPTPVPQEGLPTAFARRKPDESAVRELPSLAALFDHIRMLDADGYPHAFLETEGFRFEFRRAALRDGRITADVVIREVADA
jgi:methionyl-tRNA formyltransferase